MKIDLHFFGIAVLARAGGFSPEEALTIAYASQYVDDATEGEPIQVGDLIFEPVRTAHYGLEAYNWSVQKRIYIPFHFLPARPIRKPTDTFITAPGSDFAHMLWNEACAESDAVSRLIRMGIALHTFADTWSHKWFSGRLNPENDVESIRVFHNDRWKHLTLENMVLDLMPQVGHTEAGSYPDQPHLRWKYRRSGAKKLSERNNRREFLTACHRIYGLLSAAANEPSQAVIPWSRLSPALQELLADPSHDSEKRCRQWHRRFAAHFKDHSFEYDRLAWREDALKPAHRQDVAWDDFSQTALGRLRFDYHEGFYQSRWVRFHRAALKQRHLVLENLL